VPPRSRRRLGATLALALALGVPQPVAADHAVSVGKAGVPKTEGLRGLSGLELSADGDRFVAISDRAWFVTGRIRREDGVPVALGIDAAPVRMLNLDGAPMLLHQSDSEGLAVLPDGRIVVSFEILHRFRVWQDIHAPAARMPDLPEAARLGPNAGIEALAVGPDNALYALPETLVEAGGIPVWRYPLPPARPDADGAPVHSYSDSAWSRAFTLPARGPFHPVGADFGPDGRLYVLERAFIPPLAFRSRVRRFALGPGGPTDETTLLETGVGRHGNLEGLSAWRDGTGAIRLTMIADDNTMALQRNELVEYRVVSTPGDG